MIPLEGISKDTRVFMKCLQARILQRDLEAARKQFLSLPVWDYSNRTFTIGSGS
jgi:hypothetical protein